MLTIDDVRAVALFAKIALPELERLAQTSADLHLAAGEYAAYEGGQERALFAVLAGKIEVIRSFDGIERRLGWRLPGTIFGELPIALGTPLYGSYRASEPSRVMRVEIRSITRAQRRRPRFPSRSPNRRASVARACRASRPRRRSRASP